MAVEGEDFLDFSFPAKNETRGIDKVEVFITIFFIQVPGLFLNIPIDVNNREDLTVTNLLTKSDSMIFANPLGNQG